MSVYSAPPVGDNEIELAARVDDLQPEEVRHLIDVSLATRLKLQHLSTQEVDLWRRFEGEIGETRLTVLWCSVPGDSRLVGLLDDLVVALLQRRRDNALTAAVAEATDFRAPDELGLGITSELDYGAVRPAYEIAIDAVSRLAKHDWAEAEAWQKVASTLGSARSESSI